MCLGEAFGHDDPEVGNVPMREAIIQHLERRIQSYADLVLTMAPEDFGRKLAVPKAKSVAEHLWCIIGARESYAKALATGEWQGFSCSLNTFDAAGFERALAASGAILLETVRSMSSWSSQADEWLLAISEHEVMHEGQIIRHMYAVGRELPASWRWA
jgi:hypothetical protein